MYNKKMHKQIAKETKAVYGRHRRQSILFAACILIGFLLFAKTQAEIGRLNSVFPSTEVRQLHGLTPGKKYKIRTMAYTKKDNGQDAREKEPVMEGTYTFTADSPDQEILCIYDGLEGEVRYKLLVNN